MSEKALAFMREDVEKNRSAYDRMGDADSDECED